MMTRLQRAGMFLFIVLLPWQTHYLVEQGHLAGGVSEYLSFKLFAVDLLLFVLVGLAVWRARGHAQEYWRRLGVPLVAFLGIAFLSLSWAAEPQATLYGWLRIGEGAILLFVLARARVTLGEMLTVFVSSAIVQSAFGLWQFFAQTTFASSWLGLAAHDPNALGTPVVVVGDERILRAFGSFSHPNMLGGFLALALLASLFLLTTARTSLQRLAGLCAIVLLTAGLFVSFSRGAWLAAGVGVVVALLMAWRQHSTLMIDLVGLGGRHRRVPLFTVLLVGCAIAAVTAAGFISSYSDLVVSRVAASGRVEERSLNERSQYTRDAWTLFKKHWVTGVGLGNITPVVYAEVASGRASYDYQPPPNVLLLMATELGIFGLIIFLFLIAEIAIFVKQRCSSERIVLASLLCALFVLAMFDHYLWTVPNGILLFWLVMGLVAQKSEGRG